MNTACRMPTARAAGSYAQVSIPSNRFAEAAVNRWFVDDAGFTFGGYANLQIYRAEDGSCAGCARIPDNSGFDAANILGVL